MSLFVFGHKSPDTDSICSAISLAYLKNKLGVEAKAYALEEPRKEAKFVLDYFKVESPEVLPAGAIKGQDVALVDHNEVAQTADDIAEANLVEVIDHHKIGCLSTDLPISVRIMPVGCTCTIIYNLFKENNVEIPYEIAGLLLSAILSDTLIFKSPTCTPDDIEAAMELADIAGIDPEVYGRQMFGAGSNLDEKTDREIFYQDFKKFAINDVTVGVGQVNAMGPEDIEKIKAKEVPFIDTVTGDRHINGMLLCTVFR